jgi:hypothetical protein
MLNDLGWSLLSDFGQEIVTRLLKSGSILNN